jgi:hypothetical protein
LISAWIVVCFTAERCLAVWYPIMIRSSSKHRSTLVVSTCSTTFALFSLSKLFLVGQSSFMHVFTRKIKTTHLIYTQFSQVLRKTASLVMNPVSLLAIFGRECPTSASPFKRGSQRSSSPFLIVSCSGN